MTLRYRRSPGSVPPLTDAVGRLLATDPIVRVQTKSGAVVEVSPADVTALRVLTDAPVRTAEIRNLERAAADAWPGSEQTWLDGWLLRAHGATLIANSAAPLDISAHLSTIPAIVAWYSCRDLIPRLAVPERLLPQPPGLTCECTEHVLVRNLDMPPSDTGREWAPVTAAPDGTRWLGVDPAHADAELLAWGAGHGATRAYTAIRDTDSTVEAAALGFRFHHRRRYLLPLS